MQHDLRFAISEANSGKKTSYQMKDVLYHMNDGDILINRYLRKLNDIPNIDI